MKNATVMYGSATPESTGNLTDDVAEILDMVESEAQGLSDDELEERDVIILRDVDESVASEVVDVIGNMSQEEADGKGGEILFTAIINCH